MADAVRVRFAPSPDRPPARRRRAHRAVQLAVRAPPRRRVHPAHRGHRPRALHRGGRSTSILDAMHWLGLDWDEGPPAVGYRQTQRTDAYTRRTPRSSSPAGQAYRCYCTRESSRPMRQEAQRAGQTLRYDGRCRDARRRRRRSRTRSGFARRATGRPSSRTPPRRGGLRQRRARRLDPRAHRRHADLQLLQCGRRRRHGDHPRHPRQRPSVEHAQADPVLRGPRLSRAASSRTSR